jgi:hypothetical protein
LSRARDNIIAGKPVGNAARLRETTAAMLASWRGALLDWCARPGKAAAS